MIAASYRLRALTMFSVFALLACVPGGAAVALPPPINVSLTPGQITLGEAAQLTITSTGSGMDGLTLPVVAGLEFRVVGQSRRVEIINGATLSSISVVVRVTPQIAGIFTIPGLTPQSQPLVLRVKPDDGNGSGAPFNNPNPSGRPPVSALGTPPSGIHMSADGAAFVRMNLPKREAYVGESLPVDIEVGLREGFVSSLNGFPTLTGNDFTLNNLSKKPERVERMVDGKPFTVLTWHSVLAPVKPGAFSLSVQTPLTIRVQTRPARDSKMDDLLGDPFLQNFFGHTVSKDINAASTPTELKVLALPTEGRPADFSGAVGSFKIASDLSAPTAAVGDPVTLRLHVSGTGNFDRVDTPMLEHVEQWKTYPPKSSFNAADPIGYKGEKTFEQPLVAQHPGNQRLPDLAFSYFDPQGRRYVTAHSTPPSVTISPALADAAAGSTAAVAPTTANDPAGAARPPASPGTQPSSGLRPDHAVTGAKSASVVPLVLRPMFIAAPSVVGLALVGGWLGLRRSAIAARRRGRGARVSASAAQLLEQMQTAARSGDAIRFFAAARAALEQCFAARWRIQVDELTLHERSARLAAMGATGEQVRQLFALADETQYAGRRVLSTDLDRWLQVVRQVLTEENA